VADGVCEMPCYKPLKAFQCADRSIVFAELARYDVVRSLELPCGQCVGCRLERSRQWAIRCMHEASLYKNNCFITLTYNDEHLPDDYSLHYEDFQKFMKRLRKRFKGLQPAASSGDKFPIRFYMAGEYGENFGRPHFHACIFNFDFPDKVLWQKTESGSKIYRSKELEELWPFGYSSIGDVNFQSAAYVARYIMKKVTGDMADQHYEEVNFSTGEITKRKPEFNKMSLKPGIGADWYEKFRDDVYPHDYVVVNGKKCRPPKFYDRKYSDDYPYEFDQLVWQREKQAKALLEDNTDERLAVKEKVVVAKLSRLKRKLK
jgi:hypothetical protein